MFYFDAGQEGDSSRLGNLKYFSRETHTIYPPKLEAVWDDSSWSTGSLSPLSSTDLERLKDTDPKQPTIREMEDLPGKLGYDERNKMKLQKLAEADIEACFKEILIKFF